MQNPASPYSPPPRLDGPTAIVPATIAARGDRASERFFGLFTDAIRNTNARAASYRNALRVLFDRLATGWPATNRQRRPSFMTAARTS
jgi:hypothetical protein